MTEEQGSAARPASRRWRHRLASWLIQALLVLLIWQLADLWMTRDTVSGMAPEIEGRTLTGEGISLQQHRGEPVLIYFWADWCPVCRFQSPVVDALMDDYPVLSVGWSDSVSLGNYMADHELRFPVLADPQGALAAAYGLDAVPVVFIIDGGGEVAFVSRGYTSRWGLLLRLWLAS